MDLHAGLIVFLVLVHLVGLDEAEEVVEDGGVVEVEFLLLRASLVDDDVYAAVLEDAYVVLLGVVDAHGVVVVVEEVCEAFVAHRAVI